jgi:DNA polymerase-3 subunit delta'
VLSGEMDGLAPDHPIFRRIAAGSHTDFLAVEPLFDAKKEEFAREINVEQAREIAQFLSLTPGEGAWRVVIVDSADQLNVNAANAILKILEEPPPQTVLLLVSHNPGLLLPTIRSRCRSLRLKPLAKKHFTSVMRHIAPQIAGDELAALAQLSAHAPGVARMLQEQGALEMYDRILALTAGLPALNTLQLHAFAAEIGSGTVHANWQVFSRLMLCLLERASLHAAAAGIEPVSDLEARALARLAGLHGPEVWAEKWQAALDQFSLAEARHLDYKQLVITYFHALAGHEPFQIGQAA